MEEIKTPYKDYEIRYNYNLEEWKLIKDDRDIYCNKSMMKILNYADKLDKKDFEPFTAWMRRYSQPYTRITVTSITEDGYLWVKHIDKTRSKENASFVYADTTENVDKINLIAELNKKIDILCDEREELESSLAKVVIPEVNNLFSCCKSTNV